MPNNVTSFSASVLPLTTNYYAFVLLRRVAFTSPQLHFFTSVLTLTGHMASSNKEDLKELHPLSGLELYVSLINLFAWREISIAA